MQWAGTAAKAAEGSPHCRHTSASLALKSSRTLQGARTAGNAADGTARPSTAGGVSMGARPGAATEALMSRLGALLLYG